MLLNLFSLFTVMVISAFTLCYLPGFVGLLLTIKLGPSRVPNVLRSALIVMVGLNSALNPIIYLFRSNEFRIIFRKFFGGSSSRSRIEDNVVARVDPSRLDATTWELSDRPASFLTVPTENVTILNAPRPRLEISAETGGREGGGEGVNSNINITSLAIARRESLEVIQAVVIATKPFSSST